MVWKHIGGCNQIHIHIHHIHNLHIHNLTQQIFCHNRSFRIHNHHIQKDPGCFCKWSWILHMGDKLQQSIHIHNLAQHQQISCHIHIQHNLHIHNHHSRICHKRDPVGIWLHSLWHIHNLAQHQQISCHNHNHNHHSRNHRIHILHRRVPVVICKCSFWLHIHNQAQHQPLSCGNHQCCIHSCTGLDIHIHNHDQPGKHRLKRIHIHRNLHSRS